MPSSVFGLLVVLGTFGALAAWSFAAPLSSAAIAPGSIVVDSNRKTIQHLEGGIIKKIHVRDGDKVAAGQVLIELDDSQLLADASTLRPRIQMNIAQNARLMVERHGGRDIDFPRDLLESQDEAVQSILADQRMLFIKRRAALDSKRAALLNQREQAEALIAGLQSRLESQRERLRLTEDELRGVASLAARGNSPKRRVLELNRALAELRSEEADLQAKLAEVHKRAEYGSLEVVRLTDTFAEAVEADLQTVKNERYQLAERMQKIDEQLKRAKIVAPVDGTVVNQAVHTVGGVVAAGAVLLEIVPEADSLVIEARVRPLDVEDLQVGMPIEVRFPGLQGKLLPRLKGQLVTLSADLLVDDREGTPYFAARARVTDEALRHLGEQNLRPGMPVEVMLVKHSRTLAEYLLSPLQDFVAHAMRE
jgi:HlyD family type I secretion membrane fusion protein